MESATRRMQHFARVIGNEETTEEQLTLQPCSSTGRIAVLDGAALARYMSGPHDVAQVRKRVFDVFVGNPSLTTPVEISKDEHRKLVLRQIYALIGAGIDPLTYLRTDPAKYFAVVGALGHIDMSLAIKTGVQFSLWGGSVVNLGTKRHHDKYLADIGAVRLPGCFAMTELDHGSNVQGVQTEATYIPETQEFDIHTPNSGAIKWWIGNGALHGRMATVFAQLRIPRIAPDGSGGKGHTVENGLETVNYGVHAFLVPLRDAEGNNAPGVEIRDCGHKVGLNGIDNGAFKFTHVRVPRENLLNRFGDVAPDGTYSSPLPTASKRFAATLGELVGGRVGLAQGSVSVLKMATTIAVRYSLYRHQFGPTEGVEIPILDYQSQQLKLMPMLANAYANHFAAEYLVGRYSEMKRSHDETLVADVHALSAGLKAVITNYTASALNVCREATGGHGYASINRLGAMRNDHDIFQTFEGDNTVLLQQVAGELLKQYKRSFQSGALVLTWQYLTNRMGQYLSETNPIATHRESSEHLRDHGFLLHALEYRTAKLLHTVALRLRKHTQRLGSFHGWNRCLNHLISTARAHVDVVIMQQFAAAVQRCEDKGCRRVLHKLCSLYGLNCVMIHMDTFRTEEYVAPNKAKAIVKQVEVLCHELRAVAGTLCDGFGIPDAVMRAPLGLSSKQYEDYLGSIGW
eukprot:jgi/Mesvir1/15134/Mv14767-RA.1